MPLISQNELLDQIDPRDENLNKIIPEKEEEEEEEEEEGFISSTVAGIYSLTTLPDHHLFTLLGASFRQENTIGSLFGGGFKDTEANNPNYDPFARVTELGRDDLLREVIYSDSDEEVQTVIERSNKRIEDNKLIEDSGWAGIASTILAQLLDPMFLVPGGGQVLAGSKMASIGISAAKNAALFGTLSVAHEELLRSTQVSRNESNLVMDAISGAIIGGVLGGAIEAISGAALSAQKLAIKLNIGEDVPPMYLSPNGDISALPFIEGSERVQTDIDFGIDAVSAEKAESEKISYYDKLIDMAGCDK